MLHESPHGVSLFNHRWLTGALVAAVVATSGCADSAPSLEEPEEMQTVDDAQTPVEQSAMDINDPEADTVVLEDTTDEAVVTDEDVTIETADDADVLDGTESVEHISTY